MRLRSQRKTSRLHLPVGLSTKYTLKTRRITRAMQDVPRPRNETEMSRCVRLPERTSIRNFFCSNRNRFCGHGIYNYLLHNLNNTQVRASAQPPRNFSFKDVNHRQCVRGEKGKFRIQVPVILIIFVAELVQRRKSANFRI